MIRYLSIFEYVNKYKKDVIIMTKKKEIFDDVFINESNQIIKKYNLQIKIINLIDNLTCDLNIFKKDDVNQIFIVNNDKFVSSTRFNDYK